MYDLFYNSYLVRSSIIDQLFANKRDGRRRGTSSTFPLLYYNGAHGSSVKVDVCFKCGRVRYLLVLVKLSSFYVCTD